MSAPKRIGGDWVESLDESSGKTYYANIKTKETRWEYPEELKCGTEGSAMALEERTNSSTCPRQMLCERDLDRFLAA